MRNQLSTAKRSSFSRKVIYSLLCGLCMYMILHGRRTCSAWLLGVELDTLQSRNCERLQVRAQEAGMQSSNMNSCKTEKSKVPVVCIPLCASSNLDVNMIENGVSLEKTVPIHVHSCASIKDVDASKVLVVFKMTHIFDGQHIYHAFNNFVVNLDPVLLPHYVFHCWDCKAHFSKIFDDIVQVNSRTVSSGCFSRYIFLGEHYATYDAHRDDKVKASRWRDWARILQKQWCPYDLLPQDSRYFTLLERTGAKNGRNMHNCTFPVGSLYRHVIPTLENTPDSSKIFCNSRLLLSAEGNGLTNMLFLQPGSVVVVLWQSGRYIGGLEGTYGNMAKLLGLTMIAIPVESDENLSVSCSDEINSMFEAIL